MREAVRRGLGLERYFMDMMLHGYIDKNTWEDVWTPKQVKARKAREREEARQRGEEVEGGESPERKRDAEGSDSSDEEEEEEEEEGEESSVEELDDGVGEINWEGCDITSA